MSSVKDEPCILAIRINNSMSSQTNIVWVELKIISDVKM